MLIAIGNMNEVKKHYWLCSQINKRKIRTKNLKNFIDNIETRYKIFSVF